MLVRVTSDLHCEFWNYNKKERLLEMYLPSLPTDSDTILCLAGDIGLFNKYDSTLKPFINELAARFKHVLYVYGNHEWYHSDIWGNERGYWLDKKLPENFHILDNDYFILDNVIFIGATLWSSFQNRNELSMFNAERQMNDFQCIRKPGVSESPYGAKSLRVTANDTVDRFDSSVAFIKSALCMEQFKDMTSVVITHHSPSLLSVHERYKGDLLNDAFSTDLSEFIMDYQPNVWIHGHTHDSYDYPVHGTRIICNPMGYHAVQLNKEYDKCLVLDITDSGINRQIMESEANGEDE